MTENYERKCWNCGSRDIEPDARGVRCRSCGATWNKCPSLQPSMLERGNIMTLMYGSQVKVRAKHPSPAAARQAALARAKAK